MKFNNNFLKSRHFIVFTLVIMLILVGSINYNLSKKSFLETSNELKEYEKNMMENYEKEDSEVVNADIKKEDTNNKKVQVVDSNKSDVDEKVKETSANITKQMEQNKSKDTYFVEMKLTRDKQVSSLDEELQAIIDNPSSSQKSKDEASNMKMQLLKYREIEMNIENLLVAKGFESPIVYVSSEGASVIVKKENITQQDIGKIYDVVSNESKLPFEKIKVIPSKR